MTQKPDRTKLMSLWLVKMPWVHWTEEEREYVFSGVNWAVRTDRAEELRVAYIAGGRGESVWSEVVAHAVATEKTEEKAEKEAEKATLAEKKEKYEKLSKKKAVGKRAKDEEWLDKKIAELTE